MKDLGAEYWDKRYLEHETGWDIGTVSRPIKEYVDQLDNKELSILIPGCGYGHEGRYLYEQGFKNTFLLDFSQNPIDQFKTKCPEFPLNNLIIGNFFEHEGSYDLIIEQTLFCAINPELRHDYAGKCSQLLKDGGKLVGVLFNRQFEGGPPFGGTKEEYLSLFKLYFSSVSIEECYNSIEPRKGSEVFIKLVK